MAKENFYLLNHTERIKGLYDLLVETKKSPSVIQFISKRITEKEFVYYIDLLINYGKNDFGNIFFNYLVSELGLKGEFKIKHTYREMRVHNRADLVVECTDLTTFIFKFKLDRYVESEGQTYDHARVFEANYPKHNPIYLFIDSKGEIAQNEKFKNYSLVPFKNSVTKMIQKVDSEKDILNLKILLEVINDLHQRAE